MFCNFGILTFISQSHSFNISVGVTEETNCLIYVHNVFNDVKWEIPYL
jgi:hypothetical protein